MSLYVKYKKRLNIAKMHITVNPDADDMALSAFDTQQALDFLIKHILTEHNIKYVKNHNVSDMLSKLDTLNDFSTIIKLRDYASLITEWKTRGRYDDTLIVSSNDLKTVWELIEELDKEYCDWMKSNVMSFDTVITAYVSKYAVKDIRNEIMRLQKLCGSKDKNILRDYILKNLL